MGYMLVGELTTILKGFVCKLRLNNLEPKKMIKDSRRLLTTKNQKK